MMTKRGAAFLVAALLTAPAGAVGREKLVEPFAAGVVGAATVVETSVTVGDKARAAADRLDAKAAERESSAAMPAAAATPVNRPEPAAYQTLPLARLLPLEIEDVSRAWGLTQGRPVRLAIAIDSFTIPSVATSTLLALADRLAGTVTVTDAANGARLGVFKVVVVEGHPGALGLALRGSGLREKLAAEFAEHVARQLSGSRHKPKAA